MGIVESVTELLQQVAAGSALFGNDMVLAAFLFAVTAGAVGLCIPGLLMPISFSAGLLMNSWLAIPVVAAGAALGSHALFVLARNGLDGALGARFAGRIDHFAPHFERYGLVYSASLRVVGTPHVLVTLASAAGRVRHGSFALASLIGFLPAVTMAAGAGSIF